MSTTSHEMALTVEITVDVDGLTERVSVEVPCHVSETGWGFGLPSEDEESGKAFESTRGFVRDAVMKALEARSANLAGAA